MSEARTSVFTFFPYRMDLAQRRVSRDGDAIALTPKEFDTLLVLVEAGGRVVDKEELITRVWPDSYVGDGSLARNISVLRKTLGEEVIETHRRRGYRITLPVIPVPGVAEAPTGPLQNSERPLSAASDAVTRVGSESWRRTVALGAAGASVLLIAFVASRFYGMKIAGAHGTTTNAAPIHSILIEKNGAIDPLDEGFKLGRADGHYTHIMRNRENKGYDRWKLVTDDQNFYYRKLSSAEKDFVLQSDWRLTCVCALERGAGSSDIDLGADKGAPRFDMAFLQEGNKYFVVLTKQISPNYEFAQKIEFPGVADVDHPHTYEMRYDHLTRAASLWIDGQLMASGYRGHHQFQEDLGLMFGAATYLQEPTSSIVFREVRFEAK